MKHFMAFFNFLSRISEQLEQRVWHKNDFDIRGIHYLGQRFCLNYLIFSVYVAILRVLFAFYQIRN